MKKMYFLMVFGILSILPAMAQQTHSSKDESGISINADFENPSTATSNDGKLSIQISGGKAPYTIKYFTPSNSPGAQKGNSLVLKNIVAGDYVIVVQDADKNSAVKTITINSKN